jgi:hypothetical protein
MAITKKTTESSSIAYGLIGFSCTQHHLLLVHPSLLCSEKYLSTVPIDLAFVISTFEILDLASAKQVI